MVQIGNITYFDKEDKEFLVSQTMIAGVVDERIKELVDEINGIENLVTMNSCQGGSEPYTEQEVKDRGGKGNHCPITYVDFYAIDHDYYTANLLIAFIIAEIGSEERVSGNMSFEEDGYIDEDDYFQPNGLMSLRYRIEGESPEVISEITAAVRKFKKQLIKF
ncbi:hypothetical protein [Bacillus sp. AFS041924]|uniref:tRNA-wybutosine modification methyltransferase TYW3 n=1 Tax=Bacillus sp. AFS041924 TaxID=2033503 RepID=UPI000BFBE4A6|nr:hypothetical protein [Bacillus sp. AFS041924]PGS55104.1 hypothetical protein COC46_04050 [Bacillus sp. AFS041924]